MKHVSRKACNVCVHIRSKMTMLRSRSCHYQIYSEARISVKWSVTIQEVNTADKTVKSFSGVS